MICYIFYVIFSFYICSQYLVMIIPFISTVLSTLRSTAHLSKKKKKKKKKWKKNLTYQKKYNNKKHKTMAGPWHSAQSVDFLWSSVVPFLIVNPVLTWIVHLFRCYRNWLHGAKHSHLKPTGTFSIKCWSLIVLSPEFFICPQLFGGKGPLGPKTEILGLNTEPVHFLTSPSSAINLISILD